jgi:hypothetical protein
MALVACTPTSIQLGTVYEGITDTTDNGCMGAETLMVLTINVFKSSC